MWGVIYFLFLSNVFISSWLLGSNVVVGAIQLVAYGSTVRTRVLRKTLRGRKVSSLLRGRGFSSLLGDCMDGVSNISVFIGRSSCSRTLRMLHSGRDLPRRLGCYPFYNSTSVAFGLQGSKCVGTTYTIIFSLLTTAPPKSGR